MKEVLSFVFDAYDYKLGEKNQLSLLCLISKIYRCMFGSDTSCCRISVINPAYCPISVLNLKLISFAVYASISSFRCFE